jgi:TolA-binding protein
MKRRLAMVATLAALLTVLPAVPSVSALDERDRLFLVGERALADHFYPVARRALERFIAQYPGDARQPRALLMLGKARLELKDAEAALEAFTRAESTLTAAADVQEAKLWRAEALFRLKRFADARRGYDEIMRSDAAGPLAPDALYGLGACELELKHADAAADAFRQLLTTWPDHARAPAATLGLAHALAEARRTSEALPLLTGFAAKYPQSTLIPDAQYQLGVTKFNGGDQKGGLADLQEFVEANPGHEYAPAARRLIAQGLTRYGTRPQLQQAYTALMSQTPPTADALYEAASVATRLGQTKDRDAAWRKLKAQFPDDPHTHKLAFDLARDAAKARNYKEAVALGQTAAQSTDDGTKAEAWLLVGESELKLQHYTPAAKAFEAVGAVNDLSAEVRYRALAGLGLAREELQECAAALAAYQEVVTRSPDTALRDWARQRHAAVKGRPCKPPAPKRADKKS